MFGEWILYFVISFTTAGFELDVYRHIGQACSSQKSNARVLLVSGGRSIMSCYAIEGGCEMSWQDSNYGVDTKWVRCVKTKIKAVPAVPEREIWNVVPFGE